MTIWYTADPHFGHKNIIDLCDRPFQSAAEMDKVLLANLQARVMPEDELWVLGDFAFGSRAEDIGYVEEIFDQLPGCCKHLVVGNHDNALTQSMAWTSVSQLIEVRDGPNMQRNTLCHYPMITWNHSRRQALQLFGHVHNNWLGSRNAINVGVDVWDFMPATYDDIAQRAQTLPINAHWSAVEPGLDLT
jgi:calcineurin-like phosphoesterase family protein